MAGEFSLRNLLEILFRRKRVFLVPVILTPVFSLLIFLLIKPSYMSSTTILLGKEDILNPLVRYETAVAMTDYNRLGAFQKVIYSRPLLEEAIHKLDLDAGVKNDVEMERIVNRLRDNIHVIALSADSFQIGCTAPEAVLAKNMVETVSRLFIEKSLQGSRREAMTAVNFLQKEVDHYAQELDSIERALQQFRQANMETLRQVATLGGQLNDYSNKTLEAELDLRQEQLNEKLLTARLSGEKPMVVAQALYVQNTPYQKQYQELQLRMGNLLATREKSHPEVLKLQREMDYITSLLEDEKKTGQASETQEVRSPVYQEVSARLEDTRIRIRVLEQKVAEYQRLQDDTRKKLLDVPELEKEQARMESEIKLTRELYDTLRTKLEQARVTCEVEIEQQSNRFTIIDPPVVPLSRYKPGRTAFFIGGIAGGLCLGFLVVFLLEFTDPRLVRSHEILRSTGLRSVGVLPKLFHFGETEQFCLLGRTRDSTQAQRPASSTSVAGRIQSGLRQAFCVRRFIMPPDMPADFIIGASRPQHADATGTPEEKAADDFIEHIRDTAIAARSAFEVPDRLVWMVTSANPEDGKTLLTANLGIVLASDLKKPVLLVDANLRTPTLSRHFGHAGAPGLAEVVEGRAALDEVLVTLDAPGLSLLPAGLSTEGPEVLYNTVAFYELLETLRSRYALTLMEVPALLANSAGRLIAPQADGVLLITRLYTTKRKVIEAAIEKLPAEKIIGLVFNFAEYWIPDWLYKWV